MIGSLRGTITHKQTNQLLLEVGGVGYAILVPNNLADAAALGATMSLHTHMAVREDAITLYGFDSANDKAVFELLVSVSGVGPKLGLAVLSIYTAEQVQQAVASSNAAAFSAVSGIGKKNAERIILELKNKVGVAGLAVGLPGAVSPTNDLADALAGLGYTAAEIAVAAQSVETSASIDQQLKQALQTLARRT